MATPTNNEFRYPGVNIDLRYRLDDDHRILPSRGSEGTPDVAWRYYPIGASRELCKSQSRVLQMREVAMMMFMETITDKERWNEKVFDDDIVAKWKQEAMEMSEKGLFGRIMWEKKTDKIPFPEQGRIMSQAAFEFCIAELRDKAKHFEATGLIPTLDSAANTVVKSDSVVTGELHEELRQMLETLKADQKGNEDWHPGSNEMQLNLVHPSMYPLVWGRSEYIQNEVVGTHDAVDYIGKGRTSPEHESVEKPNPLKRRYMTEYGDEGGKALAWLWSSSYQWLPSTVSLGQDGKPKFTSYINNLDPKRYPGMYDTLEKLVDSVIPAWDQCLQECQTWRRGDQTVPIGRAGRQDTRFDKIKQASDSDPDKWVPFDFDYWKEHKGELSNRQLYRLNERCLQEKNGWTARLSREEQEEFYRCEESGERVPTPHVSEMDLAKEKWEQFRTPIFPEPLEYKTVDYTPIISLRELFKESGLQIIVKMASIELTPEKPEFPGGSWHIEGQMNERICATALYYVDCENVKSSKLAFRMPTSYDFDINMNVGQDEYNWLERIYGVSLGHSGGLPDACLQTYGDVETRQGRVLAFPNIFQHRVSPFSLKDKSKPGHRRFIALWLADPHQRILSTANVPPQQREWWEEHAKDNPSEQQPLETPQTLVTVEEAKEHRKKLMEERTSVTENQEAGWQSSEYNFCEH